MLKCKFWRKNFWEFVFVAIVLIIFLCSSLSYILLPGLSHDEGVVPFLALNHLIKNDFSLSKFINTLSLSTLMADPIVASIFVFVYTFVFYFFGVSVFVIRFVSIFFGLIFLLFFYFFVRDFLNRRIAMFSLILVATLPTLVFYIKTCIERHFLFVPSFGCLLFFWRFYKKRSLKDLCVGSMFLGLGVYHKLLFWWFFFAVIIAFFVLRGGFRFRKKELLVGFLFFVLGASPVILWNLNTPFEKNTISYILKHQEIIPKFQSRIPSFDHDVQPGLFKLSLFEKIQIRFSSIYGLLSGDLYEWKNLHIFMNLHNFLNWWFFIIAFVFLLIAVSLGIIKEERKKILFILIIILIFFLETTTLSWSWGAYQLLVLVPFCLILSAILLNCLFKHSKFFVYLLLGIIIMINFSMLMSIYSSFAFGVRCPLLLGGNVSIIPSSNIYHLAEYLQKNKIQHLVHVTYGGEDGFIIGNNLEILTLREVRLFPHLGNTNNFNKSEFLNNFKKGLSLQNAMFITSNFENFYKIINLTEDITRDLNKTLTINKTFYFGDGSEEFLLFQSEDLI